MYIYICIIIYIYTDITVKQTQNVCFGDQCPPEKRPPQARRLLRVLSCLGMSTGTKSCTGSKISTDTSTDRFHGYTDSTCTQTSMQYYFTTGADFISVEWEHFVCSQFVSTNMLSTLYIYMSLHIHVHFHAALYSNATCRCHFSLMLSQRELAR